MSAELSEQQLAEIAARVAAASAGPWETDTYTGPGAGIGVAGRDRDLWVIPLDDLDPADAEFIAHARTDVPALLAYAAELEERIERRRMRLVRADNDLQEMRGLLSPNDGTPRRVPPEVEIHERVAPAVEWLLNRVAELETAQVKAQCGDCGAYGEVAAADDGLVYLFPSGQIGHPQATGAGESL